MAQLGFGIVSYMQLLQFLQWVFFLLTLLHLPALYFYSKGTAYRAPSDLFLGGYDWLMLGNLGYSSINCDSSPAYVGYVGLQCNSGTIGQVYDYGFRSTEDNDSLDMCVKNDAMDVCKPDGKAFIQHLDNARGTVQYSF